MPTWPITVPGLPLAGTLSVDLRDTLAKGPSEIEGTEARRQRYSGRVEVYRFTRTMSAAAWADLRDFYWSDCKSGSLSFTHADLATLLGLSSPSWVWAGPPAPRDVDGRSWSVEIALLVIT